MQMQKQQKGNCDVGCFYDRKQFAFGKCPLCTCRCNHGCFFENYFQGKSYKAATSKELKKSNADVEAQEWMNNIVDVNQNATKIAGY